MFIILWQKRKIKSLLNLQDKTWHKSNVIYRAECTCGETHIRETKRNFAIRKAEHAQVSQLLNSPSRRKTRIHIQEQTEPTTCSFHTRGTLVAVPLDLLPTGK